jgi:hypothetical protein
MTLIKEQIMSSLLKISSNLVMNTIPTDLEDWNLPESTSKKARRIIHAEANKHADFDRRIAIEISEIVKSINEL